ncbi:hypothetical protein CD351_12920 [Erythrobacter sp. KY5]|uniref:hypothetical protein n=1 Tax=Erythrobacter sp. KY5 TaxID=2011159 RepID=UPI000DBF1FF0|nr:hypothetical protein [Erythrobacter sp. KY5]AWW75331.1 hypothetical protein CD351_12920 [Erythrobacter sp. KY5]
MPTIAIISTRRIGIRLSALLCLALVGCDNGTAVAEGRFEEFCRDFQFVQESEEPNLARIRMLINMGEIDPQTDLQFETILTEKIESPDSSSVENLEIAKIKVTASDAATAIILLPQAKIKRGGSISISSPEYYDIDCFSVRGRTYFDFVEKGLEA